MKKVLICGGLPRSGTTYFYHFIAKQLGIRATSPEEARYLANSELTNKLLDAFSDLYECSLIESGGGSGATYSAWGKKSRFLSEIMSILPLAVGAVCYRHYIERATISEAYADELNELHSLTVKAILSETLFIKQPTVELNWKTIGAMFSEYSVRYVICLREPYAVFNSLIQLGWIASLGQFVKLAEKSYSSTIELCNDDRVFLTHTSMTDVQRDQLLSDIAAFLDVTFDKSAKINNGRIDRFWVNPWPKTLAVLGENEFMAIFERSEACDLYQYLKDRIPGGR